ncbi:MAG: helix-turn-helix transcriptional regulator [Clostridia bacterium]|nr:helix-turn-helix transcriptional regulator [Clostridia bacterium]
MIDRILELLHERGITQKQLAEAIKVSTGNISDWKAGKAKPSIEVLSRIAEYFGVSIDYLVGRTDVPNTADLIDLYNIGVMRWINDRAFKPEEAAVLKDNFFELLLRYKTAINKLANSMYSDNRKMLVASGASCEELSLSVCDIIRPQLRDLICWIASFPYDFNKRAPAQNDDHTTLLHSLYEMLGVMPDGTEPDSLHLSEDERDLLSIWQMLDKDGRRVVLGEATTQKQRVLAEQGSEANKTA